MPPKRRTTRSAAATSTPRQQSTLSFNGKTTQVTKPSLAQEAKANQKPTAVEEPQPEPKTTEVPVSELETSPTSAEKAITDQVFAEKATSKSTSDPAPDVAVAVPDEAPDPLSSDTPTTTAETLGGIAPPSLSGVTGGATGTGWVSDEEARARKITDAQIKRYWRAKEAERLAPRVHQEGLGVEEKVLREWDVSNQYGPCIGIARLKRWKRANVLGLNPPIEVLAVLLKEIDRGNEDSQRAHLDKLMNSRYVET